MQRAMNRKPKDIVNDSPLYKRLKAEENEINKHKWYESERAGHDVGFDFAMIDWTVKFKSSWLSGICASGKKG